MSLKISEFYWQYVAEVVRVVDGDTIVLDIDLGMNTWQKNQFVRIYGVNTPEVRGDERELGLKAKAYVESLFTPGDVVILNSLEYNANDKYGRVVGDLEFDQNGAYQLSLRELLIDNGYAHEYYGDGPIPRFEGVTVDQYPFVKQADEDITDAS